MIPLVLAAAHAYTIDPDAAPCAPSAVFATLPAPGQADVPVDAPFVALVKPGCGGPSAWAVALAPEDGTVSEGTLEADLWDGWVANFDPGELDPATDHVVTLTPNDDGEAAEISFSTGDGRVAGMEGGPTFDIVGASWTREAGTFVDVEALPAADPDGLSFLVLTTDAGQVLDVQAVADGATLEGLLPSAEPPEEVCVAVTQVDALGEVHAADVVCAEVTGCGCATPTPPAAWAALLPLLALRRRR